MNPIKQLAGQTAIYGLSSIVGRLLNYLLVPLYTRIFLPQEYGIVTELYAYAGFLLVVYTYGMETAFFRYTEDKGENSRQVFSNAFFSLFFTSVIVSGLFIFFQQPIAEWLGYPGRSRYIVWFALILGFDAAAAIPFAYLRQQQKAKRFAFVKLTNIGLNIGLNLFFLLLCPYLINHVGGPLAELVSVIYYPSVGVGYIFIANLTASLVTFLLLLPELSYLRGYFDTALWKRMITYAMPLLLVGLAGTVNEMFDRMMLKRFLPYDQETNQSMLGEYGACYKLSVLMTLFIQAYRFAAEPFFFSHAKLNDPKPLYAKTMKFFVIVGSLIFLVITLYLDIFKYFIGEKYHEGLEVVPILLMANLFLGIYFNLSIWYKLTDRTMLGAAVAIGGSVITVGLNIWWIPIFGYMGSAWATLICYVFMAVASYFMSKKYYPIPYPLKRILSYLLLAIGIFFVFRELSSFALFTGMSTYLLSTVLLISFLSVIGYFERNEIRDQWA
ncbi:MAG: polysaccharide biosynthesis protein [Bacteroidetes bacterium SW_11_45_7]|nr:MAG: polysaccharide biosynthesis protein [Bacteroidetes bacterium SW_11_45_7]